MQIKTFLTARSSQGLKNKKTLTDEQELEAMMPKKSFPVTKVEPLTPVVALDKFFKIYS